VSSKPRFSLIRDDRLSANQASLSEPWFETKSNHSDVAAVRFLEQVSKSSRLPKPVRQRRSQRRGNRNPAWVMRRTAPATRQDTEPSETVDAALDSPRSTLPSRLVSKREQSCRSCWFASTPIRAQSFCRPDRTTRRAATGAGRRSKFGSSVPRIRQVACLLPNLSIARRKPAFFTSLAAVRGGTHMQSRSSLSGQSFACRLTRREKIRTSQNTAFFL
jgi:hypothetical protein